MIISDAARDALLAIMNDEGVETISLVAVGESCCGPQFGLTLDTPADDDVIEEINGVKLAMNPSYKEQASDLVLEAEVTAEGTKLYWASTCTKGCCGE